MILGKVFIDTKTGKRVISSANDTCVVLKQYVFGEPSESWTISHIYETESLTIQSFSNDMMFMANNVVIDDESHVTLHFSEPRTGFCNVLFYTTVGCKCDDAAINPTTTPTPTPTSTPYDTPTVTPTPSEVV